MGDGINIGSIDNKRPDLNIYVELSDEPDLTPQQRIARVLAIKEKAINDIVSSFNPALFLHNSCTDIYPYNIFNEYLDLNSPYTLTDLQVLLPNDLRLSNKSALHVIGQGCLQCHVALICARENISAEDARSIALEHKRKRGEYGAQIGRKRNGAELMSDLARTREVAWDIEDIIYMIELVGNFVKEESVVNWNYVTAAINMENSHGVQEMYRYYRIKYLAQDLTKTENNELIIAAFNVFGVYIPNERFDWQSRVARIIELRQKLQGEDDKRYLDKLIEALCLEDDEFSKLISSELELKGDLRQVKTIISRLLKNEREKH